MFAIVNCSDKYFQIWKFLLVSLFFFFFFFNHPTFSKMRMKILIIYEFGFRQIPFRKRPLHKFVKLVSPFPYRWLIFESILIINNLSPAYFYSVLHCWFLSQIIHLMWYKLRKSTLSRPTTFLEIRQKLSPGRIHVFVFSFYTFVWQNFGEVSRHRIMCIIVLF